MKAVVTGAAGFIGSHLVERLLSLGYKVTGIDVFLDYYPRAIKESNMSTFAEHPDFTFIEKNIIDCDLNALLDDADYVFHQAAQAGVRASWGNNFQIYIDNNIKATQLLLEASKYASLKKFVYASSSSVYGDTDVLPMKETNCVQPVSPYGVSKLAAEHLCYLYWKNHGVPVVSLRYFTVFGERQRPDMAFNIFAANILNNRELHILGDGRQSRSFTYVGNVVDANILAAESDATGEVFNIGGDEKPVILNDAVSMIEKYLGKKGVRKYENPAMGDVFHTHADCSKAAAVLGYSPGISFEEGLRRETEWIKQQCGNQE